MTYGEIYCLFTQRFPEIKARVSDYRPQVGEINTIHTWLRDGGELVFTFNSGDSWGLESYELYKKRKGSSQIDTRRALVVKGNFWIEDTTPEQVREDVLRRYNNGGVIVLPKSYEVTEVEFDNVRAEDCGRCE